MRGGDACDELEGVEGVPARGERPQDCAGAGRRAGLHVPVHAVPAPAAGENCHGGDQQQRATMISINQSVSQLFN